MNELFVFDDGNLLHQSAATATRSLSSLKECLGAPGLVAETAIVLQSVIRQEQSSGDFMLLGFDVKFKACVLSVRDAIGMEMVVNSDSQKQIQELSPDVLDANTKSRLNHAKWIQRRHLQGVAQHVIEWLGDE